MVNSQISADVWGPQAWGFLHAVSFRYAEHDATQEERLAVYNLLTSLKKLLPCPRCRIHFTAYIEDPELGITGTCSPFLKNRDSFSRWLVDFHNEVNIRLDKKVVSYDEVHQSYFGDDVCPSVPVSCQSDSGNNRKKNTLASAAAGIMQGKKRVELSEDTKKPIYCIIIVILILSIIAAITVCALISRRNSNGPMQPTMFVQSTPFVAPLLSNS